MNAVKCPFRTGLICVLGTATANLASDNSLPVLLPFCACVEEVIPAVQFLKARHFSQLELRKEGHTAIRVGQPQEAEGP